METPAPASTSPAPANGRTARARHELLARFAWPAALAGLALWGILLATHGRGGDFGIYLKAAQRFLAGAPLFPVDDGTMPFKYAPPTALLFAPLVLLPPPFATLVWSLLLVAVLAAAKQPLERLGSLSGASSGPATGPTLALAVVVLLQSFFLEMFYGQVNLPMLALLAAAAVWAEDGRPHRAGAAWALAILLKPTAVLLGVVFLARRRWRAIGTGVAFGVAGWLPLFARYGVAGSVDQIRAWLDTLSRTTAPWMLSPNTQGIPTLLLEVFSSEPVSGSAGTIAQFAALVIAAGLVFLATHASLARGFAAAALGVAFASALAWRANFVLALPAVVLVLGERPSRRRTVGLVILALIAVAQPLHDSFIGAEAVEAVLRWRPFALGFLALTIWLVLGRPVESHHEVGRAM